MGGQTQRLHGLRQRETMADEPLQVHLPVEHKIAPTRPASPQKRCTNPADSSRQRKPPPDRWWLPHAGFAQTAVPVPRDGSHPLPAGSKPLPATARMTASAPRPSVSSLMARTVSEVEASMLSFKPNALAIVCLCGSKSEVITRAPRRRASTARMMPIGPWPMTSTDLAGLKSQRLNAFHAGIDRLDKRGLFKRDAVRDAHHAITRHDPIHHSNVFREAAATGLESGGRADLLIGWALREDLMPAVVTIAAWDVMEDHHPVAELKLRHAFAELRLLHRWFHVRRCAGPSASRWQSS